MRDRELGRGGTATAEKKPKAPADHRQGARTSAIRIDRVRDAVERERQHQLAGARRPAKRALGLAHALAGANDAPQDIGQARACARDRVVEAALGVELRSVEVEARLADPPRPRATGAASHAIVTRGASCARSQSLRRRSPASNWRWLTRPRENNQPSGDSARLTVTERRLIDRSRVAHRSQSIARPRPGVRQHSASVMLAPSSNREPLATAANL